MRKWPAPCFCAVLAAIPAGAQTSSRMSTAVKNHEAVRSGAVRLEDLTPAERLEVLRIAEAPRNRRRGVDMDCSPEQEMKPMSDLERASWRLKCRR